MPPKGRIPSSAEQGLGNLTHRGHGSRSADSAATPRSRWDRGTDTHPRAQKAQGRWSGCQHSAITHRPGHRSRHHARLGQGKPGRRDADLLGRAKDRPWEGDRGQHSPSPSGMGATWQAGLQRPAQGSSQRILRHTCRPGRRAGPTAVRSSVRLGESEETGPPDPTARYHPRSPITDRESGSPTLPAHHLGQGHPTEGTRAPRPSRIPTRISQRGLGTPIHTLLNLGP